MLGLCPSCRYRSSPSGSPAADRVHLAPTDGTFRLKPQQYVCCEKPTPPLTGKDGSGRRVHRVGKCHGTFRISIRKACLFIDTRLALPTLEIAPFGKLRLVDEKIFRHLRIGNEDVTERLARPFIHRLDFCGHDCAALHDSRILKRGYLKSRTEALRVFKRVIINRKRRFCRSATRRKRIRHNTRAESFLQIPSVFRPLCVDIHSAALLREPVIRSIHHTPFRGISKRSQARQNNCEVATALRRGTLEQAINIFEQTVLGLLQTQEPIDVPP